MKRRFIIIVFSVTTFLTAFSGLASILAAAPNTSDVESTLQVRQSHVETAPIIIIAAGGGKRPNGNSWGG